MKRDDVPASRSTFENSGESGNSPFEQAHALTPLTKIPPYASSSTEELFDSQRYTHVYTAIDVGSHCCRLLSAVPWRGHFRIVQSYCKVVELALGLSSNNELSDHAMTRTLEALHHCKNLLTRHAGTTSEVRAIATEALRRAHNGALFVERARLETNIPLAIIQPYEEARLALSSCVDLLYEGNGNGSADRFVVLDVGGASTEIILGHATSNGQLELIDFVSIPLGVITLTEQIGTESVSENVYNNAIATLQERLIPFAQTHRIAEHITIAKMRVLAVSGPANSLIAIMRGWNRYNAQRADGAYIRTQTIRDLSLTMRSKTFLERSQIPSLGADRAGAFVAGCLILEAICGAIGASIIRVANRGLRDGMLLDMMGLSRVITPPTNVPNVLSSPSHPSSRRFSSEP